MQTLSRTEVLGFVELQVGSLNVRVPICAAETKVEDKWQAPQATFAVEGESYAIMLRGDPNSQFVGRAVAEAADDAVRHLSRKLLN